MAKTIKGRTVSPSRIADKNYEVIGIDGFPKQILGEVPWGFTAMVIGKPKQGKSTLTMRLLRELAPFGKCYYVSAEMNEGKALQDIVNREGLSNYKATELAIGLNQDYTLMLEELEKNRAVFIVIDSIDYMDMTKEQFGYLQSRFPNKCFILISWEGYGGKPDTVGGRAMTHMADIIINVACGVATSQSRFGSTEPYVIIPEKLVALDVRKANSMGISKDELKRLKSLNSLTEEEDNE